MLDWNEIDTVLLDMDGTLLDLYFDNYFWQIYLPEHWGKKNGLDKSTAIRTLLPKFREKESTLSWYCLDYWSTELGINILQLKSDIEDLIKTRPNAVAFLEYISTLNKSIYLVTNAHQDLIEMKMLKTGIGNYFTQIICAHDYDVPKENKEFWQRLESNIHMDKSRTLFIDDNQTILGTAEKFGIKYLYTIAKPDSHASVRKNTSYKSIFDFNELMS